MILFFCSCKEKSENQKTEQKSESSTESKTEIKTESELDTDYSISAELFAKDVLKEKLRKHTFNATDLNKPKHIEIFDNVGLKNIIAYSNKNYPKNSEPNYYEHFTLFVANYQSELNALKTFALIEMTSKENPAEYLLAQKKFVQRLNLLLKIDLY